MRLLHSNGANNKRHFSYEKILFHISRALCIFRLNGIVLSHEKKHVKLNESMTMMVMERIWLEMLQ